MLNNGEGRQVTASATSTLITFDSSGANSLSVDVEGTTDVYVLVNCTTAEFDAEYSAGTTIKVRNGVPFAFYGDQFVNIKSVVYRTASGTSDVNFGAY